MSYFRKNGDAARLRREATVLAHVAHPDVVSVVSLDEDELILEDTHGLSLTEAKRMLPSDAVAFFASLAAVVAHVHSRGVAHTRIDASHVIVRNSGRPLLCGFAEAIPMPHDDDSLALSDVAAIGELMLAAIPEPVDQLRTIAHDPIEEAAVERLTFVGWSAKRSELTATQLCAQLRTIKAVASPTPTGKWRRRLIPAALAVASIAIALTVDAKFSDSPETQAAATATTTTAAPSGSGTLTYGNDTFTLASATDQALAARWNCGNPLPVLLRKSDGSIWVFDNWPAPGTESSGRQVADVAGASSIQVASKDKCDAIAVSTADGNKRELDLKGK